MSQSDTKERILDAAERLFAREGFHSTSLRSITREAGANLAAVNYHFGSKEALIEAVFERRLRPLNRQRLERLDAVRKGAQEQGRLPGVEETLRAFIEPTVRFSETGDGAKAFITLVGRAMAEPDDSVRSVFVRMMVPIFLRIYEILGEALPEVPAEVLYWRLHFTLGAMGHIMCLDGKFGSLPSLPPGVPGETRARAVTELLIPFVRAGMEAV